MLENLSYRFKIPLSLILAVLLTGFVGAVVLSWQSLDDLRQDLFRNALEVSDALSGTLSSALKNDDLWRAYQAIRDLSASNEENPQRILIVMDNDNRVFVSNQPKRFPTLSELDNAGAEPLRVKQKIMNTLELEPIEYNDTKNQYVYFIIPLLNDQVRFGSLIFGYHRSIFESRFKGIIRRITVTAMIAITILLPFAWFWGKRIVKPLMEVAAEMGRVGSDVSRPRLVAQPPRDDEIGQLWRSLAIMLEELDKQDRLKERMLQSERLAAVGRLAAGVAHEINNPLGGMLTALNTCRKHGSADPVTSRTLSLIERGLHQIKDTVSALLVEARSQSHNLLPQDIDDVFTLVQPSAQKKAVTVNWINELTQLVPLPSTPVRQVMLNLSMNAVAASPTGGAVDCRVAQEGGQLSIAVKNRGEPIPEDHLEKLFEPFHQSQTSGNGLGLWVTYQIAQQLNGSITVHSDEKETVFEVILPVEHAA